MSYELKKPYTEDERKNFIVIYNHNEGLRIEETELYLFALEEDEIMSKKEVEGELIDYPVIDPDWDEKQQQKEQARIQSLFMTRSDFFDGTIKAFGADSDDLLVAIQTVLGSMSIPDVEKKVAILADICKSYNCKVVIEASAKQAVDEETLEVEPNSEWVSFLFSLFKKYNIDVIGRTPSVKRKTSKNTYYSMWKEDEIRLYLMRHPEILHYCVLDDDDLQDMHRKSDLDKVRNHLVKTRYISDNHEEEGLLPEHKRIIKDVLRKENEIRRLVLKKRSNIK